MRSSRFDYAYLFFPSDYPPLHIHQHRKNPPFHHNHVPNQLHLRKAAAIRLVEALHHSSNNWLPGAASLLRHARLCPRTFVASTQLLSRPVHQRATSPLSSLYPPAYLTTSAPIPVPKFVDTARSSFLHIHEHHVRIESDYEESFSLPAAKKSSAAASKAKATASPKQQPQRQVPPRPMAPPSQRSSLSPSETAMAPTAIPMSA